MDITTYIRIKEGEKFCFVVKRGCVELRRKDNGKLVCRSGTSKRGLELMIDYLIENNICSARVENYEIVASALIAK